MPAAAFDAVPDESLGHVLEHLAVVLFVRPLDGEGGEWERRVRARGVPSLPPLTNDERGAAGRATLSVLLDNGFVLQAPTWAVLHVEDSEEKADHVLAALPEHLSCQARFKKITQAALSRDWLLLERELDQFEVHHRDLKTSDRWGLRPLNRLRLEALELSRVLQRVKGHQENLPACDPAIVGAEPAPEATASTPSKTPLHAGYFSAADLAAKHQVNAEALRKRLERWRLKSPGGPFIEDVERKSKEPGFLYAELDVLPLIESLKKASDSASGKRPASRKRRP